MNTLSDTAGSAAGSSYADSVLLQVAAGMQPGWVVLRDCSLAGHGPDLQARVRYALLHPEVGVALIDVLPGSTTRCAPDWLRRSLGTAGFQRRFGGCPPIIYLCVPSRVLPDLEWLLAPEFEALPPLALSGGDVWVSAARDVLAAQILRYPEGQATAGGRTPPTRSPGGEHIGARFRPRLRLGTRGLVAFWGSVALALACGAFVLQHLGTSNEPAVAHAIAGPGAPETTAGARFAAAPTGRSDAAWLPLPDPVPVPPSTTRVPGRLVAEAARVGVVVPEVDPVGRTAPPVDPDRLAGLSVQASGAPTHSASTAASAPSASGAGAEAVSAHPAPSRFDSATPSAGGICDEGASAAAPAGSVLLCRARLPHAATQTNPDAGTDLGAVPVTEEAPSAAAEALDAALRALARPWLRWDTALGWPPAAPGAAAGWPGQALSAESNASAAVMGAFARLAGETRPPPQADGTRASGGREASAMFLSRDAAALAALPANAMPFDVLRPAAPGLGTPEPASGLGGKAPPAPSALLPDAAARSGAAAPPPAAADASAEQVDVEAARPNLALPPVPTVVADAPDAVPRPDADIAAAGTEAAGSGRPRPASHPEPPPNRPTRSLDPAIADPGMTEAPPDAGVRIAADASLQGAQAQRRQQRAASQMQSEAVETAPTALAAAPERGTTAPSSAADARTAERPANAGAAPASKLAEAPSSQGVPPPALTGSASPGMNSREDGALATPATEPTATAAVALAASAIRTGVGTGPAAVGREPATALRTTTPTTPPRAAADRAPTQILPQGPPPRAARGAAESTALLPGSRCRVIVLKAQLGEEVSPSDQSYLRHGCGARR